MKSLAILLALAFVPTVLHGEEAIDYVASIKPILHERCYACHGALKQEGGLRLDTAGLAIQGGESGQAIHRENPDGSLLFLRVSSKQDFDRMPPEGLPLKSEQIALLRTWIAQGAKGPADEKPEHDPREHWAFKSPVRPSVPTVAEAAWNVHPIDAFLANEREKRGLAHQPPADKRLWLRRVYLDLIGLPPTRKEMEAFVADTSPQAIDAVVTRLLNSPQYGERWGRHWMDVWRYSDWWGLGAEVRNSQKHIWHWRDWIIESLNADKGYDHMLREMLAADELYPNDLDRLRGSGFLARQYFKFNRTSWLDETIEHTSKAMLGLTFNCAKCHDHKYDPIAQTDYYRLRAIFEPYQVRTELVPGEIDFERDGIPRAFDCHLEEPTFLHIRGDDRNPDKSRPLEPTIPTFLSFEEWKVQPVALPPEAYQPALRSFVLESHLKDAGQKLVAARTALDAAKEKSASFPDGDPLASLEVSVTLKTLVATELMPDALRARDAAEQAKQRTPPDENATSLAREAVKWERKVAAAKAEEAVVQAERSQLQAKDDKKAEAEKNLVAARTAAEKALAAIEAPAENFTPLVGALKTLESNLESEDSRRKPFPKTSSGRRSAFAKWVTDARNPLTARVAVNHIWLRHMGRPLVPTVFDFGRKGTPPTHPELLDWLAAEFMEHGWSMKHLHRIIVTSQAYRMSSSSAGVSEATLAADPENRLYWRGNPVRMEAQIVRDSLLHLAGELDVKLGGPSIPVSNANSRRRSLYFVHSHNEHQKFLSMFDDAGVLDCYRRAESIVPQQALALENSDLAAEMSKKIAARIAGAEPNASDQDFLRLAFITVLAYEPSPEETALALEGLARLTEAARRNKRPSPEAQARVILVQALLNHNDFITIR